MSCFDPLSTTNTIILRWPQKDILKPGHKKTPNYLHVLISLEVSVKCLFFFFVKSTHINGHLLCESLYNVKEELNDFTHIIRYSCGHCDQYALGCKAKRNKLQWLLSSRLCNWRILWCWGTVLFTHGHWNNTYTHTTSQGYLHIRNHTQIHHLCRSYFWSSRNISSKGDSIIFISATPDRLKRCCILLHTH